MKIQYIQKLIAFLVFSILFLTGISCSRERSLGLFEDHGDIGGVLKSGSVEYDATQKSYLVSGGGENIWFNNDAFYFVWKKMSGDLTMSADIRWTTSGGNPHRKACLMIRQNLNPDSPFADAVIHGDGLTSLQYREVAGGQAHEIRSNILAPQRIGIKKEGDYVLMSLALDDEFLHSAGGSYRIKFTEPFLVGLGVCSHQKNVLEKTLFSKVEISSEKTTLSEQPIQESTLEKINISSRDRQVIYVTRDHIEAPNWSPDGSYFLFNSGGQIYKLPVRGGEPQLVNTEFANRCNNDHGISPDGKQLVISDGSQENRSIIYTLPISGGTPHRITQLGPSYWHDWSPDGRTLAYCARRNDEYDIYTIPATGGIEKRLTTAEGLDDGPDYSPDGEYIYFNSVRTGTMQIWRMKPDGSEQQQMTFDEHNDWFPHPSPDGKWIVFVSYEKDITGHPANKDVMLRLMPAEGGQIQVLTKLFGGQGTINVPSWSPDSKNVAFVSYRLINP